MYDIVTIRNIEDFIGKTVDRKHSMFHHYPITFQKNNDAYFYIDKNDVMMPFNKEDEIIFDRIINAPRNIPVDMGTQQPEKKSEGAEERNVSDNIYNSDGKDIRFINSSYKELFTIPDGGYITITLSDGEQLIRKCKFHDECHVDVGVNVYHICEFAERMERNGSTYAPCPEPEVVGGYMITDRMPVRDKVIVLAHNPNAAQPWVTWQKRNDRPGYDWGHYWSDKSDARTDYFRRHDAERTGKPYDHTKAYKQPQKRGDAR